MTLANIYTTTSVHVPRVSYSCPQSPQETLQDQHIGLAQAPMKSPLVPWASARETLCTLSKSRISFSPVLCSSCTQPRLPPKLVALEASLPKVRALG